MDPVIVAIVTTALVQLGGLLGAVWYLSGTLATIRATMVTTAACEAHRSACALERKTDARADALVERLDPTGPVRLLGGR